MIASAELFRFAIPLRRALPVGDRQLTTRTGLLIRLCDDAQRSGWGEVAPLTGISVETIEAAESELIALLPQLVGRSAPSAVQLRDPKYTVRELTRTVAPSISFGLESAYWSLAAQVEDVPLGHAMNPLARATVSRNALIPSGTEALDAARHALANGYDTLKLKVGRGAVDDDIAVVRAIRGLSATATIRLDANRRWTRRQALMFAEAVRDCGIAYIEEPLDDAPRLPQFAGESGLPVALDESVRGPIPFEIPFPGMRALVLHPTLMGGLSVCLQWAESMQAHDILTVISSTFESSVGLTALAHLASALPIDTAAGLDTGSWLSHSLVTGPLFDDTPVTPMRFPWLNDSVIDSSRVIPVTRHGR